jgi:ribosomal-protein-alanine N-acetyltransferase
MTQADVARVMELALGLKDAPQWPESAYLAALDPAATPRRVALVACGVQDEYLAGFAIASCLPPQGELETIAVVNSSRRRGLGRRLLDGLIRELQAGGAHEVALEVRGSNHAALGLYRSLGFVKTGLRKSYYADPVEDAVLMRLRLG